MATTLETLRALGLTNLFGRRLSIDKNEYLLGGRGNRVTVEDLTTAGTTVSPFGMSRVTASGSSQGPVQYTLPSPNDHIGAIKILSMGTGAVSGTPTTSTGSYQFLSTANNASIVAASDGTTKSLVNLLGAGGCVTLFAESSAVWRVIASCSTGGVSYTTST
jgi:hypothetical protein